MAVWFLLTEIIVLSILCGRSSSEDDLLENLQLKREYPFELKDFLKSVIQEKDEFRKIREAAEVYYDKYFDIQNGFLTNIDEQNNYKQSKTDLSFGRRPKNDVLPYIDRGMMSKNENSPWGIKADDAARYRRGLDLNDYNSGPFDTNNIKIFPRSKVGVRTVPGDKYGKYNSSPHLNKQKNKKTKNSNLKLDSNARKASQYHMKNRNKYMLSYFPENDYSFKVSDGQSSNNEPYEQTQFIDRNSRSGIDLIKDARRCSKVVKKNDQVISDIQEKISENDAPEQNKIGHLQSQTMDTKNAVTKAKEKPKIFEDSKKDNHEKDVDAQTQQEKIKMLQDVDQPTSAIEQLDLSTKPYNLAKSSPLDTEISTFPTLKYIEVISITALNPYKFKGESSGVIYGKLQLEIDKKSPNAQKTNNNMNYDYKELLDTLENKLNVHKNKKQHNAEHDLRKESQINFGTNKMHDQYLDINLDDRAKKLEFMKKLEITEEEQTRKPIKNYKSKRQFKELIQSKDGEEFEKAFISRSLKSIEEPGDTNAQYLKEETPYGNLDYENGGGNHLNLNKIRVKREISNVRNEHDYFEDFLKSGEKLQGSYEETDSSIMQETQTYPHKTIEAKTEDILNKEKNQDILPIVTVGVYNLPQEINTELTHRFNQENGSESRRNVSRIRTKRDFSNIRNEDDYFEDFLKFWAKSQGSYKIYDNLGEPTMAEEQFLPDRTIEVTTENNLNNEIMLEALSITTGVYKLSHPQKLTIRLKHETGVGTNSNSSKIRVKREFANIINEDDYLVDFPESKAKSQGSFKIFNKVGGSIIKEKQIYPQKIIEAKTKENSELNQEVLPIATAEIYQLAHPGVRENNFNIRLDDEAYDTEAETSYQATEQVDQIERTEPLWKSQVSEERKIGGMNSIESEDEAAFAPHRLMCKHKLASMRVKQNTPKNRNITTINYSLEQSPNDFSQKEKTICQKCTEENVNKKKRVDVDSSVSSLTKDGYSPEFSMHAEILNHKLTSNPKINNMNENHAITIEKRQLENANLLNTVNSFADIVEEPDMKKLKKRHVKYKDRKANSLNTGENSYYNIENRHGSDDVQIPISSIFDGHGRIQPPYHMKRIEPRLNHQDSNTWLKLRRKNLRHFNDMNNNGWRRRRRNRLTTFPLHKEHAENLTGAAGIPRNPYHTFQPQDEELKRKADSKKSVDQMKHGETSVARSNFGTYTTDKDKDKDMEPKKASQMNQINRALNGHLAAEIIEKFYESLKKREQLNKRFSGGLHMDSYKGKLKKLDVYRNSETEGDIKQTEKKLHQLMTLLNNIISDQVKRRTCIHLSPALKKYLASITKANKNVMNTDAKISDGIPLSPSTVHETPADTKQENFLFENKSQPSGKSVIKKNIRMIRELLGKYGQMSPESRTRIPDIEFYLKKHLFLLRKMLRDVGNEKTNALKAQQIIELKSERKGLNKPKQNGAGKDNDREKSLSSELVNQELINKHYTNNVDFDENSKYMPFVNKLMEEGLDSESVPNKYPMGNDLYDNIKQERKREALQHHEKRKGVSEQYKKLVKAVQRFRIKRVTEERLRKLPGGNGKKSNLKDNALMKDNSPKLIRVKYDTPVVLSLK